MRCFKDRLPKLWNMQKFYDTCFCRLPKFF
jgi:hypothetical protein